MRNQGFTLLELMIVIAVIAIIVSLAIPSLQQSRKAATEAAIISTMRSISTANEQYRMRFGVYADPLDALVADFLPQIGAGNSTLEGYESNYNVNGPVWWLQTWPKQPGVTGDRSFWTDVRGVIRVNTAGLATSQSPPLD